MVAFSSSLARAAGEPHFQGEGEQRPHLLCNALTLPSFTGDETDGFRMRNVKGRLPDGDSEDGLSTCESPLATVLNFVSFPYTVLRCACVPRHMHASEPLLCRTISVVAFGLVVDVGDDRNGLRRRVQSQYDGPGSGTTKLNLQ